MHSKLLILPTMVLTSLFGLVACGGGSSNASGDNSGVNTNGSGSSGSKVIKVYDVDSNYDHQQDKLESVELTEFIIRDGSFKANHTQIIGKKKNDKDDDSDGDDYYLAPNFEAMSPADDDTFFKQMGKTVKVLSANSFSWQVKSKTGKALTINLVLDEVDISGKTEKDENIVMWDVSRLGNNNNKLSYTFPKGSSCYVTRGNYSFPHFTFEDNEASATRYKSVKEWYDSETRYLANKNMKLIGKKTLKVGDNNQYTATYLQLEKINPNDGEDVIDSYPAIVEYKGKLYDADYDLKEERKYNTDPSKGKVECGNYNQTTANYIVNLAKKY